MKIQPNKLTLVLLFLFMNSVLYSQQQKEKPADLPNNEKEVIPRKHKNPDLQSQDNRVPVKKHRPDSLKGENGDSRKYKTALPAKPNLWQNAKLKKIAMDIPCPATATVYLKNMMHNVHIATTNNNKVTLVTTVFYQGESSLTDEQWFSKLNLSLASNEKKIQVNSGDVSNEPGSVKLDTIFNGVMLFDGLGNALARRTTSERDITLYVPAGVKVNIDSKFADIMVEDDMGEVTASINNGGLKLMDAKHFETTSVYGNISAGNIMDAIVNVTNGKLTAKNIDALAITSKNSSIALDNVRLLTIRDSKADQFEIKEVWSLNGQMAFGELRLSTLTSSADLSGINANLKIKKIAPAVKMIKVNTQYADLVLPTGNLKNYTVTFEGNGGKVSAPFEKNYISNASFTASIGNINEKPTEFRLACPNCSVNFK